MRFQYPDPETTAPYCSYGRRDQYEFPGPVKSAEEMSDEVPD